MAQAQAPVSSKPAGTASGPLPSTSSATTTKTAGLRGAPATQASRGLKPAPVGPTWAELTPAQQQSLQPLVTQWPGMSEAHKRKWLALSQNYPKLPATEQAKLHSRMTEWAALSPQQRVQARLNFADTKRIAPQDKKAKWEAYQSLSPEEKRRLAARATPKPAGAAPAVKPVPPQKLAVVPKPRLDSDADPKTRPSIPAAAGQVDHNTLLPHPQQTSAPAASPAAVQQH